LTQQSRSIAKNYISTITNTAISIKLNGKKALDQTNYKFGYILQIKHQHIVILLLE